MKKLYQTPSVEENRLDVAQELMNDKPTISDGGYGWDDEGPRSNREE